MEGLQQVIRSFGLALVGTMHPRMMWLSFRPFLIVSVLWGGTIWLTWTPALELLSTFLTTSIFTSWIQDGLIWAGFENARAWIAPLFFRDAANSTHLHQLVGTHCVYNRSCHCEDGCTPCLLYTSPSPRD